MLSSILGNKEKQLSQKIISIIFSDGFGRYYISILPALVTRIPNEKRKKYYEQMKHLFSSLESLQFCTWMRVESAMCARVYCCSQYFYDFIERLNFDIYS